jgi:LmeA-like phospholipid-binding
MGARAVAVGAVVVVALLGGAVVADRWALAETEDRVERSLRSSVDDVQGPAVVTIDGFPFLTQVAAGTLDALTLTVDGVTVDGVVLRDVAVEARDVGTREPYPAGSARLTAAAVTLDGVELQDVTARAEDVTTGEPLRARTARLSGTLTTATLQEMLVARTGRDDVRLGVDDGLVTATTRVLGQDVTAELAPRPDGRTVAGEVVRARVAGLTLDVEDLPRRVRERLADLSVPVDGLPAGVELTDVIVVDDGVRITAAGSDVSLPGS